MTPAETYQIARAVVRVMRDSERTDEIHRVEELTGRFRYRELLARDRGAFVELLREQPELCSEQVDYDGLRRLPADTLGAAYVRHLDDNGLSADYQAAPTRFVDDAEIAYLMRRFRQTHDVWHALVGLGTTGHEEVILHAFSWGQLRLPVSAMVVLGGSLKHILFERRWAVLRRGLRAAYDSGRDAAPLMPVYWERMWSDRLSEVRARLRVRPCDPALVH